MSTGRVTRPGSGLGRPKSPNRNRFKAGKGQGKSSLLTSGTKAWALGLFLAFGGIFTSSTLYLTDHGMDPYQFYSNMANPYMRFVHVPAGLRREEIAQKFKEALSWNSTQVTAFLDSAPRDDRGYLDGYFLPGDYFVSIHATGKDVAKQMLTAFNVQVGNQILATGASRAAKGSAASFKSKINLDTAVRIASIIQKEAAGKADANLVSGVIWNRLFKGMDLEMDATLQYVKGTSTDWWPQVASKDKFIDSPFNTYENPGLPPTAISNPSIASIAAAYAPAKTNCLFYLHDNNGIFHCTSTYQAHVDNIQKYLVGTK